MNTVSPVPASAFFGRLLWILIGPLFLVLVTFGIVRNWEGWTTGLDMAFFVILGLMMLGRWLEFRGGRPETGTGEPATSGHLRRYLMVLPVVGLMIWAIANLVGQSW